MGSRYLGQGLFQELQIRLPPGPLISGTFIPAWLLITQPWSLPSLGALGGPWLPNWS